MRQDATVRLHHATQIINANARLNRWEEARRKAVLVQFGQLALGRSMKREPGRVEVTFEFTLPTKRTRDRANLHPTCKALLDGIVRAKTVLVDDSDDHIDGPNIILKPELSGQPGYTHVTVIIEDVRTARAARLREATRQILAERPAVEAEKRRVRAANAAAKRAGKA